MCKHNSCSIAATGHPAAEKRTQIGDLDTPQGTAYNGRHWQHLLVEQIWAKLSPLSLRLDQEILFFGGQIEIREGLLIKAITHVGIAAFDDGLKNQYDHNKTNGWHYRPHWQKSSWYFLVWLELD